MNNHFLKYITINKFKCFDNFDAEGFGQVNLIGGKNNVGKTAFMEACFVNAFSKDVKSFVQAIYDIKFMRENLNLLLSGATYDHKKFLEQCDHIYTKTNINSTKYTINDKEGIKTYNFEFKDTLTTINVNDFSYEGSRAKGIIFIDNFGLSNNEISTFYSYVQINDKESELNNILNEFYSDITVFKVIDEKPQCKTSNKYLEITELGDGVRHLVSIVCALYASENGYLFIDEIDNGIHYSALEKIWRIIFDLSKKLNVQVFTTTHSKECINSFNNTQLKSRTNDSFYFEMAKNKKSKNIFMTALDGEQLKYELTHQGKYRGE